MGQVDTECQTLLRTFRDDTEGSTGALRNYYEVILFPSLPSGSDGPHVCLKSVSCRSDLDPPSPVVGVGSGCIRL